jgi:N-acetylmuramoyl-L-alanine amidase
MFLDYYEFHEQPFAAGCSEVNVYRGTAFCQQLDSLTAAVLGDRGNLLIVGASGMGKTTLLQELLERLRQTKRAVFRCDRQWNSRDLLNLLLSELGVDSTGMDLPSMQKKLNEIWFAEMLAGKQFVLLVDDIDLLENKDQVLGTLQLLSKLETSHSKFVQIVSTARPDLLNRLDHPGLSELHKHMAEVVHIEPQSPTETAAYIRHRLSAAGYPGNSLFDSEALAVVAVRSEGIPSNINKICSRALLESYARGLRSVSADIVEKAEHNLGGVIGPDRAEPAEVPSNIGKPEAPTNGPVAAQLTYKISRSLTFPRYGVWAGAAAVVLLSAGLALPHGMFRGMTQIISPRETGSTMNVRATPPALKKPAQPPTSVAAKPAMDVKPSAPSGVTSHNLAEALSPSTTSQDGRLSLTRELGLKINRIVIDPGHGGFDTGAKGPHGLLEKDVCLDVALRLGQMIEANIPGAQVVYTRKDDSYVPLEERTAIANAADADLFISIHANSSDSPEVRGVETYYLSLATSKEAKEVAIRENALTQSSLHELPDLVKRITNNEKTAESKVLAAEIQDTLSQRLQLVSLREKNRGVKQAPFIVLTGANMPAILSEISFVSNANDESLLLESSQRQRIADGLYRGIAAYLEGLRSLPQDRQKLITDNRVNILAGFARATLGSGRNPL